MKEGNLNIDNPGVRCNNKKKGTWIEASVGYR
jgi:hypothetical protein